MNRLLKNTDGQHVYFRLLTTGNLPNPGAGPDVQVSLNGAAKSAGGRAITDLGEGLYVYPPLAAETNADEVAFYFGGGSGAYPPEVLSFRTEVAASAGEVTLAAAQPLYAPAKAGDAMTLAADQDVRNILGDLAGDVQGDIIGDVPSPATLSAGACNSFLDLVNGISTGVTPRQAFRNLLAALVDVTVGFELSQHNGPSNSKLTPRFPTKARALLGQAASDLLKAIEFNTASPELGMLPPNLVSACQQVATALDAVRTASA